MRERLVDDLQVGEEGWTSRCSIYVDEDWEAFVYKGRPLENPPTSPWADAIRLIRVEDGFIADLSHLSHSRFMNGAQSVFSSSEDAYPVVEIIYWPDSAHDKPSVYEVLDRVDKRLKRLEERV